MRFFTRMTLVAALLVFGMTGCKPRPENLPCGGNCPEGSACRPDTNKCEPVCNENADCGKCAVCKDSFCNKYADFCVISVEPQNGATNIPVSTQHFKVVFSDDVAVNTIADNRVSLANGDDMIASKVTGAGATVTIDIDTYLLGGNEYSIRVGKEVMSANNNYLKEDFVSTFTTQGSESDSTGPAGYGLSPVAGQMKSSDGKYTLDVVGGPVAGTAEKDGKSVTVSDGFWK